MSIHETIDWLTQQAIQHLSLDSRHLTQGDAYVVLAGSSKDASQFIPQALANGASALLIDEKAAYAHTVESTGCPVPYKIIPQLYEQLSALGEAWYKSPSADLNIVGITGTNGKTSSAQWIAKGLEQAGQAAGSIGTLGCVGLKSPPKHEYTTPDPLSFYRWCRDFANEGIKHLAIEISSHALDQHRCDHTRFHTVLFTNLSRDHLDYHASFEEYAEAKARLFTAHHADHAVINIDDEWGQELARRWKVAHPSAPLLTYSLEQAADLKAEIQDTPEGLILHLTTSYGKDTVLLPYLNGRFNAYNILGVVGVWIHLGLTWERILALLPTIKPVLGRMNKLGGKNAPIVIVDYAHTPDALEKVLTSLHSLRNTTAGKLWCIFGAGGDRDPGKRPIMGATAAKYSDHAVVTSDNPRTEDPSSIAQAVYEGIPIEARSHSRVIVDRRQAIASTLNLAKMNDIVLIAGKGHEPYQDIQGVKHPFSDTQEVETWLQNKRQPNLN